MSWWLGGETKKTVWTFLKDVHETLMLHIFIYIVPWCNWCNLGQQAPYVTTWHWRWLEHRHHRGPTWIVKKHCLLVIWALFEGGLIGVHGKGGEGSRSWNVSVEFLKWGLSKLTQKKVHRLAAMANLHARLPEKLQNVPFVWTSELEFRSVPVDTPAVVVFVGYCKFLNILFIKKKSEAL